MFAAVVVLPQPPLLVPELATGAADETAELRAACDAAAVRLAAVTPDWVAVGADARGRRTVSPGAAGSFLGFGVDVRVALDTAAPAQPADPRLPLPLLIAGWVAARTGAPVRIRGELVAPDADPGDCAALGAALADAAAGAVPVGLLVVGDGATTHTEKAPGYLDERAGEFDAAVAEALAAADADGLLRLDPGLATELGAIGRAPWQVLAGATRSGAWRGELLYSSAPFGVAYHVAVWMPA
ncbi:hypothetical protein [Pseudonocardia asaccharolytica]|uniref:DODA-type extradiol aromatic ring-opening family dioxygenase n=1 Tax=Pseudonocardia asaccharolytica TaxID=54010 RepID=UPI00055BA56E|nr:hypothetical protein [Pseudonocardia asaccharolytica]